MTSRCLLYRFFSDRVPTWVLSGFPSGPVVKKLGPERIVGFPIIAGPDFPAAQLFPDWFKWVLSRFRPGSRCEKRKPWEDCLIFNNSQTGFSRRRSFPGFVQMGVCLGSLPDPVAKKPGPDIIAGFSIIPGPDFPAADFFPDWSRWVLSRFPPGSRCEKTAP